HLAVGHAALLQEAAPLLPTGFGGLPGTERALGDGNGVDVEGLLPPRVAVEDRVGVGRPAAGAFGLLFVRHETSFSLAWWLTSRCLSPSPCLGPSSLRRPWAPRRRRSGWR